MEELIRTSVPIGSAIAVILFGLPAIITTLAQRGIKIGLSIMVSLGVLALIIEGLAVKTGLLYGGFRYGDSVGYRIFDSTPWLIAFAVPPIIIGTFWLANTITQSKWRVLISALMVLPVYVTVAPAVTKMTIWQWDKPGIFFGVPLQAFLAWFISSFIGASILSALWGEEKASRKLAYSAFAIVWFWGGVNIGLQQYIPGAVGLTSGLILLVFMWREKRRNKKEAKLD